MKWLKLMLLSTALLQLGGCAFPNFQPKFAPRVSAENALESEQKHGSVLSTSKVDYASDKDRKQYSSNSPVPGDPLYAPPKVRYTPARPKAGSLYRENGNMALFQDRRAYRIGDMLTVLLSEQTTSSKNADTSYSKSTQVKADAPKIAGKTLKKLSADVDADRNFDGSASSSQGNKLNGSITVLVQKVLPNGILVVSGEKWINLNQDDEYIRLTGLVRSEDIDRDNQVPSQRVGDARISYSGRGTLADSNSSGWLNKFFNSNWVPF